MKKIYAVIDKNCIELNNEHGEIEIIFENDFDYSMFQQILRYEFGEKICDKFKFFFFNKLYLYHLKNKAKILLFGKDIKLNSYLSSNEVAKLLDISLQNLSYLRSKKMISFHKISERNYIYPIDEIIEFMTKYSKLHNDKKVNNEIFDENVIAVKADSTKIVNVDVLDKYLYKNYVIRIPETRYEKGEKFFLNFSYIFQGSGLILINDDGIIEDVYEHKKFTNSVDETIDVMENSSIKPFIEETGIDYKGFTRYYFTNIYKRFKRNNFADLRKEKYE